MRAHAHTHALAHAHERAHACTNDYIFLFLVWGEWTECTKPCGNGTQERTKVCGPTNVTCFKLAASCNLKPCIGTYLTLHDEHQLLFIAERMTISLLNTFSCRYVASCNIANDVFIIQSLQHMSLCFYYVNVQSHYRCCHWDKTRVTCFSNNFYPLLSIPRRSVVLGEAEPRPLLNITDHILLLLAAWFTSSIVPFFRSPAITINFTIYFRRQY